ncbi:metallo-betalactamase superfamily protein [Colletotrichum higginsianum]|nr:metallo-betalactamase superfamily protein [Colletotrichum higginsianum]
MSPFLISKILANNNFTYREEALWTGERLHGDLTVLFDAETSLPYAIRSAENHDIFGPSTNDLVVYDYIDSNGVKFPTGWKTFYNGRHLLMTSGVSQVLVNPSFAAGFFDGPGDRSRLEKPRKSPQQDFSEVGERSGVYIWLGPFAMTAANISASQPLPELPGLWYLQIGNVRPTYRQVVLVLEDSVIVMDSPPHQSLLVLEWIEQTIGRKVTHVWDYVNAGAKVIVPIEAKPYYSAIPGIEFITFT